MDRDFLIEAVKRAPVFEELRDGPRDTGELDSNLALSRSTIHRTTQSFMENRLVEKSGDEFELTGFGRTVASEIAEFEARMKSSCQLEPFLNTIGPTDVDVPVERFTDATVTRPKPRQPHFAVKRIIELIEESDSLRMFSSIISPFYVDVAHREMLDGMKIAVIFDPEIIEVVLSEYYDKALEAAETGMFEVQVHDEIPFELFIFDDRIGMAAHDETGIPRAFVEADSPDMIEWAEELYESYEKNADHIEL